MRRAGDQRSQVKDKVSHLRGKRLLHLTLVNDCGAPASPRAAGWPTMPGSPSDGLQRRRQEAKAAARLDRLTKLRRNRPMDQ
jgi:hypothetical protein